MPVWISKIIVDILTRLASTLYAEALKRVQVTQAKVQAERDVDDRLNAFKEAYREAFNGEKVTPEQDQKLKDSISSFIRGV